LIVPGSDDPAYTASKLYPYVLAAKPMLAVFHERSSVVSVIEQTRAGTAVTFNSGEDVSSVAARIRRAWFDSSRASPATDWQAFDRYTAREMTRTQCALFESVCGASAP